VVGLGLRQRNGGNVEVGQRFISWESCRWTLVPELITWVHIHGEFLIRQSPAGRSETSDRCSDLLAGTSRTFKNSQPLIGAQIFLKNVRELTASDWHSDLPRERLRTSFENFRPLSRPSFVCVLPIPPPNHSSWPSAGPSMNGHCCCRSSSRTFEGFLPLLWPSRSPWSSLGEFIVCLRETVGAVVPHHPSLSSYTGKSSADPISTSTSTPQHLMSSSCCPWSSPAASLALRVCMVLPQPTRVRLSEMATAVVTRHSSPSSYIGKSSNQVVNGPVSSSTSTPQQPISTALIACNQVLPSTFRAVTRGLGRLWEMFTAVVARHPSPSSYIGQPPIQVSNRFVSSFVCLQCQVCPPIFSNSVFIQLKPQDPR